MSSSGWCDLPSDIWDLVLCNLVSTDRVYSVACAAEALAALGQVCKHTRRLAAERWEALAAGCPSVPPCPLTSLPFVFGLDSSATGERGIFSVSRHGRRLEWPAVAVELHRGRDSQVNFGPLALQTCLAIFGVKRAADWGDLEACAAELRARLPTPGQVGSCRAPLKLLLEVRRLRCETLAGPEAKRCFHLSNADLSCLALVKEPSLFSRSGRARQYRLLDAQRAARDKYGSEAAMLRQARRNREAAQRFHKTSSGGQQERQRQLLLELEARGLNILDGFLAAQRYIQGLPGGPNGLAGTPQSLEEAAESIARRRFIVAHCSPERALALAGCQWAAQETEQLAVKDRKFFLWEEQLKREGLLEWLESQGSLAEALECSNLPASMHREIKEWFLACKVTSTTIARQSKC
ncbi:hypothetical protein COCSUDRAFT_48132 [Coccomyxa subellipsoidea C-169]|uniref:Uncharacterized protein n=1 Tax=Coccomyxa subellipsoidea (strain C-169) TaxID=574566 RepID=I0YSW5_COCSC|nr:hypothetical protein COCSUDRAFT_48132 [Coccomyxa subellipsoidea C-169]EIE21484.1 hypothetical protein COCSUDRAFT_48132 [Coccomyxa subellipsoidea C-169]|eukprot:XP_005646028.1 hypothetical protein COCSUDRAFT_48132 [Coccomyxa subellipsoidea C-169]